jgi:FMN phosphatase YigB (HAD superfamily)
MQTLLDLYKIIREEEHPKYIIFCDMDGVLVDFDKGYYQLTGKHTHHADVQVKKEFWKTFNNAISSQNTSEFKYWSELEWMSDGKQLWSYIKKYNPYILTAPTFNPESKEGKSLWVTKHLDNVRKLYFKSSSTKAEYSRKNRILIDDRAATIDDWNARGGIGILHVSAQDTIQQLKQLGL